MEHLHRPARAATTTFQRAFGGEPIHVAAAPGRVNLIGEHVDHCGGPVLPLAIDLAAAVAAGPGTPGLVRAVSRELGSVTFGAQGGGDPGGDPDAAVPPWARAILAIAERLGHDPGRDGLDIAVASDIPVGGGLSSSAAVLVAAGLAFDPAAVPETPDDETAVRVAGLARAVEHAVLGIPCGPMDQLASALGRPDQAMLLECDRTAWRHVPLPRRGVHLLILDTGLRHDLADGRYAVRRAELDRAAAALGIVDWPAFANEPPVSRTARLQHLASRSPADALAAGRAHHVAEEIRRTRAAAVALDAGDAAAVGRALDASHASLRDDFDTSIPGIEAARGILRHAAGPSLLGSRMVGGGWGGAILALTGAPLSRGTMATITRRCTAATGRPASLRAVRASGGARRLAVPVPLRGPGAAG